MSVNFFTNKNFTTLAKNSEGLCKHSMYILHFFKDLVYFHEYFRFLTEIPQKIQE